MGEILDRPFRLAAGFLMLMVFLFPAGCSHFDFGAYETLDAWYQGGGRDVDWTEIGIPGIDGTALGYAVNDVTIRTPLYLCYETTWILLLPVAIVYYPVRFVVRGVQAPHPAELPSRSRYFTPSPIGGSPADEPCR